MDILAKLKIKAVLLLCFMIGVMILFLDGVNKYTRNPIMNNLDYYNDNKNNGNSTLITENENSENSMKPNATEIYNEYVQQNYTNTTNDEYMIHNSKRKKVKKEYKPVQIGLVEN
ncbi:hypothetical protein U3516DRAFT_821633 [Neocallimastix sp. 'constans']